MNEHATDQPYTTDCPTCGATQVHDDREAAEEYAENHPHTVYIEAD